MQKKRLRTSKDYREVWESIRDSAIEIASIALTEATVNPAQRIAEIADGEAKRFEKLEMEKGGKVEE